MPFFVKYESVEPFVTRKIKGKEKLSTAAAAKSRDARQRERQEACWKEESKINWRRCNFCLFVQEERFVFVVFLGEWDALCLVLIQFNLF